MNTKIAGWMVGGLITASVLGVSFGIHSIGNAAPKDESMQKNNMMMQHEQMSPEMMNSPEMQKKCSEMMESPEMQNMMHDMMKQPSMQSMMKKMIDSDPEFKQMISDMVNHVDDEKTAL